MEMMDKRLNDKGKNWRHVFKVSEHIRRPRVFLHSRLRFQALTLLDYCLHAGSENVVIYFRDNIYIVK
jgi:epsin